ncbi:hypothetical protein INT45_012810 [Circinella minor]|uniref:Amino acid transporter n=1 Tax=Circinella minor TaxID=1195481 RepID=A0A8H7S6I8_9FUNG|nr:hypothetical protein INT45_012810 [Circinella minor]
MSGKIQHQSKKADATSMIDKSSDIETASIDTVDHDEKRLEELGYKQEFKREINLFVQAGFAFSTMAVLPNWLIGFAGAMSAGGPMSLFWGIVVVSPFVMCIALSMAEVFSAYPVNGGVYSWCYLLSSEKWGPLMSWLCGYIFVGGLVTGAMTLAYSMAEYTIAISNIVNEHQITNSGAYVGLYCAYLLLGVAYSYFGVKFSGYLNQFMVFWVLIGSTIIIITMPAMAPTHHSATWVFTEFQNSTGYQNSGLAFFLGLLQAGWTLIGYENGAQIAEGTKNAARTGPRGIIIAVIGAIFQSLALCISTLFSIQDLDELLESSFPLGTLFVRATTPKLAAFFLVIVCISQFASLCNTLFTVSQLMWSMSRDKCLPNHQVWYNLSNNYQMPVRLLLLVALICIVLIMPSLASSVYWSAMMSTSVICLNVAYGLPYFCRLVWKRDIVHRGPFNLGRYSLIINFFAVAWIAFFGVILCIPSVHPVDPVTMNWASLMIGAILIFSLVFWFISGRKNFKGPIKTLGDDINEK